LNDRYPERSDEHMIDVKHLRDVNLDTNYPYLQKGFFFKCQRALLHVCRYSVLPIVMWVRHGLRIHGGAVEAARQEPAGRSEHRRSDLPR